MLYTLEKPKPLIDFPHITHHCRLEKCSSADIRTCSLQKTHKCREIYKCSQRAWVCIRRPWWRVQLNYRYTLYIVAKDHGSPPNDNIVTVIIHVLDENDNPPRFLNNSFFVNVQEKLPVGTVVTSVTAKDTDAGNNGEVRYTIDQGNRVSISNQRDLWGYHPSKAAGFWAKEQVSVEGCSQRPRSKHPQQLPVRDCLRVGFQWQHALYSKLKRTDSLKHIVAQYFPQIL